MNKRNQVARITDPDRICQGLLVRRFDMAVEGGAGVVAGGWWEWKGSRCVCDEKEKEADVSMYSVRMRRL